MIQKIGKAGGQNSKNNYADFDAVFKVNINVPSTSTLNQNIVTNINFPSEAQQIIRVNDEAGNRADITYIATFEQRRNIKYGATTASNNVRFTVGHGSSSNDQFDVSDSVNALLGSSCATQPTARINGSYSGFLAGGSDTRVNSLIRNWRGGSVGASVINFCFNECDVEYLIGIKGGNDAFIQNEIRGSAIRLK